MRQLMYFARGVPVMWGVIDIQIDGFAKERAGHKIG